MKEKPICATCGSEDILADAFARWNHETQQWELDNTFDKGSFCETCDNESSIDWIKS